MTRGEVVSEGLRLGRVMALATVRQEAAFTDAFRDMIDGDFTDEEKDYIEDAASGWCTKILDEMRVAFLAREALSALDVLDETLGALDRYVADGEGTWTPRALRGDATALSAALAPFEAIRLVCRARVVLDAGSVPGSLALDMLRDELRAIAERGTVTEALHSCDPDEDDGEPWGDVPLPPRSP